MRQPYTYPTHPPNFRNCQPGTERQSAIIHDGKQIAFLPCGVWSGLRHDIDNRFCAFCKWHDPVARKRSP